MENDRLAGELERQYGVTIRILRNAEADPTGLAQDYAGPDCAARCLEAIDQALSAFPSAFFQNDVVFLLATRFSPEAVVSSPGALVLRVSCTALDVPGMQASLAAYSADRFLYEGSCQPEGYAPRGFVYGYPQERYLFSEDTPYTGYFLSMTAQQSPEQDVREILLALFCDPGLLEFAEPDTPFYEKMVYCCEQFLEWRPELAENQAVQYFLLL